MTVCVPVFDFDFFVTDTNAMLPPAIKRMIPTTTRESVCRFIDSPSCHVLRQLLCHTLRKHPFVKFLSLGVDALG